jgi:hypothetical protein
LVAEESARDRFTLHHCKPIRSETSTIHPRVKSVCLTRTIYNIVNIISRVQAYMMDRTDLKGKARLSSSRLGLLYRQLSWVFHPPQASGHTYEKLSPLFANSASARKFKRYAVHLRCKRDYQSHILQQTRGPIDSRRWHFPSDLRNAHLAQVVLRLSYFI